MPNPAAPPLHAPPYFECRPGSFHSLCHPRKSPTTRSSRPSRSRGAASYTRKSERRDVPNNALREPHDSKGQLRTTFRRTLAQLALKGKRKEAVHDNYCASLPPESVQTVILLPAHHRPCLFSYHTLNSGKTACGVQYQWIAEYLSSCSSSVFRQSFTDLLPFQDGGSVPILQGLYCLLCALTAHARHLQPTREVFKKDLRCVR